jgi:branched-chain amino acid transport system ATP-binding protein
MSERPGPLLEATALSLGYGKVPVVRDLSISVGSGEIVALLGANGAGKTTTLLGLAGVLRAHGGDTSFRGGAARHSLHQRARQGLAFVPSERPVVRSLTVRENLRIGRGGVDEAVRIFPELARLLDRKAGLISGGEQQMLTLGRALACDPVLVLADELSLGLAPVIVHRLLEVLRQFALKGAGVLLVEQQINYALEVADHVYVMRRGQIALEGSAAEMKERVQDIEACYFSGADPEAVAQVSQVLAAEVPEPVTDAAATTRD